MKDTLTDDLKPAAVKILNCFRERGLRTGEMIGHWDFGDAVIWGRKDSYAMRKFGRGGVNLRVRFTSTKLTLPWY